MHVCLCVCVRLWVGDRRRAKNIPCLSTHIYHPSPRLLLIYSYSPSAHRLHNACTTQTLISKCLLVLIKGLFMSEQVWTGEHCRILQKQLVVRLLKSFLMKNTLRGVSHGSKHVLFSPCGPQSDRSLFKHNPSILGFQSCDVVQSWQKLSVPWWSAGSPADSISQNSYFCWLSEYFFKIGIQASESDATIVVPGLLCMLCSKHVVREFQGRPAGFVSMFWVWLCWFWEGTGTGALAWETQLRCFHGERVKLEPERFRMMSQRVWRAAAVSGALLSIHGQIMRQWANAYVLIAKPRHWKWQSCIS